MRVLMTGGTGFIGSAFVRRFLDDNHQVIVLSRNPERTRAKTAQGLMLEAWDGKTATGWGQLISGVDVVVNLAGERLAGPSPALRWSRERKSRICESRREAGSALVEAIREADEKPRIFVQASGLNYYPVGDAIVKDDSPPGEGFLPYVCKDCWEDSTQALEAMGVRRLILRMAPVLGPGSPLLAPMILQHKLYVGGKLGSGTQWMSWIHIDDVVSASLLLISHPSASGPFIFASPNPVTNAKFSQTLGKVIDRPSWFPAPALLFKLAFGEMSTTLLDGVRAYPENLLQLDFEFEYPQLERALENSI